MSLRWLPIVLAMTLIHVISEPVQAQTANDGQYYGSSGVGHDAATDALRASRASDDAPNGEAATPEEGVAFATEVSSASNNPEGASADDGTEATGSEKGAAIDSLPDTGGASLVRLSVLLIVGVVLFRTLVR